MTRFLAMNVPPGLTPIDPPVFGRSLRRTEASSKEACAVNTTPVATTHIASMPPSRKCTSVPRRPLDSFDDDNVQRCGARLQSQAELLLDRCKNRHALCLRRRRPFKVDVVEIAQAGA